MKHIWGMYRRSPTSGESGENGGFMISIEISRFKEFNGTFSFLFGSLLRL